MVPLNAQGLVSGCSMVNIKRIRVENEWTPPQRSISASAGPKGLEIVYKSGETYRQVVEIEYYK